MLFASKVYHFCAQTQPFYSQIQPKKQGKTAPFSLFFTIKITEKTIPFHYHIDYKPIRTRASISPIRHPSPRHLK
jgi:hypothetical protein